jgi:hypothetical protein
VRNRWNTRTECRYRPTPSLLHPHVLTSLGAMRYRPHTGSGRAGPGSRGRVVRYSSSDASRERPASTCRHSGGAERKKSKRVVLMAAGGGKADTYCHSTTILWEGVMGI